MIEGLDLCGGRLERQPRLPDAAGANEREQAAGGIGQAGGDIAQFLFAPHEGRGLRREVMRMRAERSRRGELPQGQVWVAQLVDVLGMA